MFAKFETVESRRLSSTVLDVSFAVATVAVAEGITFALRVRQAAPASTASSTTGTRRMPSKPIVPPTTWSSNRATAIPARKRPFTRRVYVA